MTALDQLHLLAVDDEATDLLSVRRALREGGSSAVLDEVMSAAEALEQVAGTAYDCIFLDYYIPGVEGLALVEQIRQSALGSPPIVIFTGRGDEEVAVELMKAGVADYLPKASLTPERLASSLRHALEITRADAARRAAETELRESRERLRAALDASGTGTFRWDTRSDELGWDDNLRRLCGVKPDDDIHTLSAFLELVHEEDRTRLSETFTRAAAVSDDVQSEFRVVASDGSTRWLELRGQTFAGPDRRSMYVTGACRDVTEQKRTEEELRDGETRERFLARVGETLGSHLNPGSALRALTDSVVPAIADFCVFDVVHTDGFVERVASKYADAQRSAWFSEAQRGLPSVTAEHHPAARVLASGVPELVADITDDWIVSNSLSERHRAFAHELGVRSLIRVPMSVSGEQLGVLTIGMAASGRRYSERDLTLAVDIGRRAAASLHNARLYAELQEAIRARDEVTSIVSHDLRNPVNTINMAAALLTDFDLDEHKRQSQANVIRRCASQMTRLLDDLLEMSKAEGGRLTVEARPDDIAAIARDAFEAFSLQARDLGLDLRVDIPDRLPPVLVDRQRITQVLSNLLGNALKFTSRGGQISLSAEVGDGEVTVRVRDTGIGIAEADIPHVFDRFWQAKRAERASAGLGLAIAKSIVESHGGRIQVDSTQGSGTEFWFTVPIAGLAETAR